MRNFSSDRDGRGGGRRSFGGGFRGRGSYGRDSRDNREMTDAVCSNCGKNCKLPFRPTGDRPVYCSDCFEKMGDRGERRSFDRPRFTERRGHDNQSKVQFEAMNAKLDKILSLLQPNLSTEIAPKKDTIFETSIEETK